MVEIAKRNNVSERTIYRYKEYKRSSGIYADVLSSLQLMQDYGVKLICVEDGRGWSENYSNGFWQVYSYQ